MPLRNQFEHQSIKYAVQIQNILFILLALSIICISFLLAFVDPYALNSALWLMWGLIWVFLSSTIAYTQFWWYFSYKAQIIYVHKINLMIYRSVVIAAIGVYSMIQAQTGNLNYFNLFIIAVLTTLYYYYTRE